MIAWHVQATGEAQFMDDIHVGGGLFATYVTSTVASAAIKTINPAKAIALRGVVTFISAATVKADGYCNFVGYMQLKLPHFTCFSYILVMKRAYLMLGIYPSGCHSGS